ncbi:MAG: oligosaccharide flippase family protein, partial [Kiritimatiellae bacterium]|nr:oligosaccharide flippase family protein [Kiritimatiellia bacterium]
MKLDFARNTRRNALANAIGTCTKLLFPFLNRTLFLWLLGPGYLGLNGLFGSILGVLMLAELGFGTAVVCSMYKPVADDDRELVCAYLEFYRNVYRCVGLAIFAMGLCLLPFLDGLVHGDVPPGVDLRTLYVIHLVNTSASYFLFAYRGSVLGAHNRNDVIVNIRTGVSAAQYVAVFAILALTRNYCHYVIATVFFTVVQNILLVAASRRIFPDISPRGDLPAALRRKVLSDVKSIFLHKVGGVVAYSMDNVVISAFLGLVAVAAYGNYYYVVTAVAGLASILSVSATGGFGNRIYTAPKSENFALFMRMERITLLLSVWCAAVMTATYQPFMELWTKCDPSLMRHMLTPVLMVAYFYVNQTRQMLLSFKSAAGLWRQDRLKPIVSGAFNLTANILFVVFLPSAYKLDGVILSTILAFVLVEIPWETKVVFSGFFGPLEAKPYFRMQAGFLAAAAGASALACLAARAIPLDGFAGLAAKG